MESSKQKKIKILKIVRRLPETRLETNVKKEAEKIRKHEKKNRRFGNC